MKKQALISVFDKTGIEELASEIMALRWEIVSTGGTFRRLKENRIPVKEVADLTGFPECFDGRVKTLHPKIEGGILYRRDNSTDQKQATELNIPQIDLVVCNLYPFKQTLLNAESTHASIVENIDIGGPTMLRAAAKNYNHVTVITDPADYPLVIEELKANGTTSLKTREYLAAKVFNHTAHYDALIASYFNKKAGLQWPETVTFTFEQQQQLRYGENPHQRAAFYRQVTDTQGTLVNARQLHGKELSFNNINDTNGALEALKEFEEPTVVAVKHANPCGIGSADTIAGAYTKAYEADTLSIYGGIVAANREVDAAMAALVTKIFVEVIVAPSFTSEALDLLTKKKNIRILELSDIAHNQYNTLNFKKVQGGLLLQENDNQLLKDELQTATQRPPTDEELKDLIFAWKVVKHAKSNGIVLAKNKMTTGIGPGQVSRIWALENAIKQAGENSKGSVMASDAFFPFSDSVEAAAKAGITAIIQPGGSIRDKDSIEAANKHNIAMVFTGMRHFKH